MKPPTLETNRLVVRMGTEADVPAIVAYLAREAEYLAPFEPLRPPGFLSEDYWLDRVQKNLAEFQSDTSLRLFAFAKARNEVIGTLNFTAFARGPAQYCVLGFGLGEQFQGQGFMREALEVAIAYVFRDLNMHRIMANHMPHNRRSGGLLRRLGFQPEGYARDYIRIAGAWEDHVLTSLTNPEWRDDG